VMGHVTPPRYHVGVVQDFVRQTLSLVIELRQVHRRNARLFRKIVRDWRAQALRVDPSHLFIFFLMDAFIPHRHTDARSHVFFLSFNPRNAN
jgi:hypothetical protein